VYAEDRDTEIDPTGDGADEPDSYATLLEIARAHGPEEIKHLTRAYQAIAPAGGGKIIDLTALLDKATPST
jgi:hypothetical protein